MYTLRAAAAACKLQKLYTHAVADIMSELLECAAILTAFQKLYSCTLSRSNSNTTIKKYMPAGFLGLLMLLIHLDTKRCLAGP